MIVNKMANILADVTCYQTHTVGGVEVNRGIRGIERRNFIRMDDVVGKRILDLGCATGAECFWAVESGAREAVGLEAGLKYVEIARKLKMAIGVSNVRFEHGRIGERPKLFAEGWDTVFAFSVMHHTGYARFWNDINCSVVYLEGGADCHLTAKNFSVDGWAAELLGYCPNNRADTSLLRPLFRLVKA